MLRALARHALFIPWYSRCNRRCIPTATGGFLTKNGKPPSGEERRFSSEHGARSTFLVLLAMLAMSAVLAGRAVRDAVDASWWVDHTFAVERELATLRSSVRAAEAAYLEFAVTGQEDSVGRLEAAEASIAEEVQRLQELTGDNPHQQRRIVDLRRIVDEASAFGASVVTARREGGWDAARSLLTEAPAKGSTRVVVSLVTEMMDAEKLLFRERSRLSRVETRRAAGFGAALALVALTAIGIGYFRMRAGARYRRREETARARIADRLRSLTEAAREFSATTYDLSGLLDVVARCLGELLGDMCTIRAVSEDGEWLESTGAAYHRDPELLAATREVMALGRQRFGEGLSGRAAATGKPLLASRTNPSELAALSEPRYRPFLERLGITSSITIPLMCRGKVVGLASLMRSDPRLPYDEDDLHFVESVADHAALAIGNARSYAAEKEARARFTRLSESGIIGVVVHDLGKDSRVLGRDNRVVEVNDALLNMLGYSRDEILSGRVAWKDLTPTEWSEVDALAIDQLLKSGIGALLEKEYIRKDGSRVPVLTGSALLEGDARQCISFVLDLTERKQAQAAIEHLRQERALDEQRAMLAAIVDASDDAIIGKTLEGVITSWNHGAQHLFGYPAGEIVGKSIWILIPPGRETEERTILEHVAKGQVERFDTVRRRKDGRNIDVSVTSSPVRDSTGRVIGISKVARDITDRIRAEAALARAKDAAEAASRELEAFSYSVAHDLRAPLRGMNGFAQVLLDKYRDKFDAEGQDWLQEILLNAKKMGSLIDGLLSLAQWTRSELRPEDVDLSAIVREISQRLSLSDPDRKVEIEVEDGLHANVDSRLARALLENLLTNAWKFTSKAHAARIEFGATEKDGARAFFVRDNGAGFDMAYAGKLFAPFQRLHSAAEFPGTGIGLATVQRIVRRHGGHIWAEGVVDGGATLSFAFPARASEHCHA
jgi:PAS domain S-box-containing protein